MRTILLQPLLKLLNNNLVIYYLFKFYFVYLECDNVSNSPTIKFDQQKIIERNPKEYDPRDDFPEPGIGYVMRNPRCSQLIPLNAEKFVFFSFKKLVNLKI